MLTARVFQSGNSQAVRIPKEYHIDEKELFINRVGNTITLFSKNDPWGLFKQSLGEFSTDFFADGRNQPDTEERDFGDLFT
jgi:antitoxin VapB